MWCIQWHTPTNSIKARTNMIKVCYRDPLWEFTIKFHLVRSSDCPERKGTIRSVSGGDREKIHGLEVSSSRSMHHPLSLHALLYNHNLGHYVSIHWTSFIIYRVKTKDHASVTTWNVLEPIHLPAQKLRKSNSSGQVQDKRGPPSSFNTKSSRLLFWYKAHQGRETRGSSYSCVRIVAGNDPIWQRMLVDGDGYKWKRCWWMGMVVQYVTKYACTMGLAERLRMNCGWEWLLD